LVLEVVQLLQLLNVPSLVNVYSVAEAGSLPSAARPSGRAKAAEMSVFLSTFVIPRKFGDTVVLQVPCHALFYEFTGCFRAGFLVKTDLGTA
jgi:hypothetical protein